jgi:hypothetical protein
MMHVGIDPKVTTALSLTTLDLNICGEGLDHGLSRFG